MSISMVCPQCSATFNFNDDAAGKKARCQRCQHIFTIEAPPAPSADVLNINLELVDDPPPAAVVIAEVVKPTPTPAKEPPRPAPAPKAATKPSQKNTSADDFDTAAFGGFGGRSDEDERPARPRRREDDEEERPAQQRRSRDDDDDDDRRTRGRRRREDDEEPAFSRNQRRQDDLAERGSGSGIRAGKYPFWLKLVVFAVILAVTAGSVQFWLKDQKEEEGTFNKIKKKVIKYAVIGIVMMLVLCGGGAALILALVGNRSHSPPSFPHPSGPTPQPGLNPGAKQVETIWTTARTPDPLPDWNQWKAAGDLTLAVKPGEQAWYSERPGKYLAIGRITNLVDLTVWNLETKQKAGEIKDAYSGQPSDRATLSPDGQYFCLVSTTEVSVFSSKSGKKAHSFRGEIGSRPVWADFPSPDRLLTLFRISDRDRLESWDLNNGARGSYEMGLDKPMLGMPTLSPNGRFFAYLTTRSLEVYDTRTRKTADRLPALLDANASLQEVIDVSYSPDGQSIAAFVRVQGGDSIIQWGVADGNITRQIGLKNMPFQRNYRGRRLEWLPDRRGWLVNGIQPVGGNGAMMSRVEMRPNEATSGLRRIVNNDQMLIVRAIGGSVRVNITTVPK